MNGKPALRQHADRRRLHPQRHHRHPPLLRSTIRQRRLVRDGNSIFIFEVAGLCIGHLGHLHHKLDDSHFAQIGRIDILMVPIDGSYTMSLDGMSEIRSGCARRWCCRCTAS